MSNVKQPVSIIRVIPDAAPEVTQLALTLENMQHEVGGYIEILYPFDEDSPLADVCLVCNEEGKLRGLDPNRALYGKTGYPYDVIMGTFLVVGCHEEAELDGLTPQEIDAALKYFAVQDGRAATMQILYQNRRY